MYHYCWKKQPSTGLDRHRHSRVPSNPSGEQMSFMGVASSAESNLHSTAPHGTCKAGDGSETATRLLTRTLVRLSTRCSRGADTLCKGCGGVLLEWTSRRYFQVSYVHVRVDRISEIKKFTSQWKGLFLISQQEYLFFFPFFLPFLPSFLPFQV